jgi:hypothetical protein
MSSLRPLGRWVDIDLVALVAVGLLVWVGTTLLIDAAIRRHRRPSLTERLAPYQHDSLADEARRWLDQQP